MVFSTLATVSKDRSFEFCRTVLSYSPFRDDNSATATSFFILAQPNLYDVVLGFLELINVCYLLWFAHKQKSQVSIGLLESASTKQILIFPMYLYLIWIICLLCLIQGALDMLFPVFSVGRENVLLNSALHSAIWACTQGVYFGILVLLCCRGVGRRAARTAFGLGFGWACLCAISTFAMFISDNTSVTHMIVSVSWTSIAILVNFFLLLSPEKYMFKRPAAFLFNIFFFFAHTISLVSYVLAFFDYNMSYCLQHISLRGILALAAPYVTYRVLLNDSAYWLGIADQASSLDDDLEGTGNTTNFISAPLEGLYLEPGSARAVAKELDGGLHKLHHIHFASIVLSKNTSIGSDGKSTAGKHVVLGAGSTSRVFKATYQNELVAVKMVFCVDLTPNIITGFSQEAALLSSLRHINIVGVRGMCVNPPALCLVMELCGGSLMDLLDKQYSYYNQLKLRQTQYMQQQQIKQQQYYLQSRVSTGGSGRYNIGVGVGGSGVGDVKIPSSITLDEFHPNNLNNSGLNNKYKDNFSLDSNDVNVDGGVGVGSGVGVGVGSGSGNDNVTEKASLLTPDNDNETYLSLNDDGVGVGINNDISSVKNSSGGDIDGDLDCNINNLGGFPNYPDHLDLPGLPTSTPTQSLPINNSNTKPSTNSTDSNLAGSAGSNIGMNMNMSVGSVIATPTSLHSGVNVNTLLSPDSNASSSPTCNMNLFLETPTPTQSATSATHTNSNINSNNSIVHVPVSEQQLSKFVLATHTNTSNTNSNSKLGIFRRSASPAPFTTECDGVDAWLHQLGVGPKGLTWLAKLHLMVECCESVVFLHTQTPPIIHLDIKSQNYLLGRDGRVKLADLELSRRVVTVDEEGKETAMGTSASNDEKWSFGGSITSLFQNKYSKFDDSVDNESDSDQEDSLESGTGGINPAFASPIVPGNQLPTGGNPKFISSPSMPHFGKQSSKINRLSVHSSSQKKSTLAPSTTTNANSAQIHGNRFNPGKLNIPKLACGSLNLSPTVLSDALYQIGMDPYSLARPQPVAIKSTLNNFRVPDRINWLAPEIIMNMSYSHKADVYSLACVLWEIATGTVPFDELEQQISRASTLPRGVSVYYKNSYSHAPEVALGSSLGDRGGKDRDNRGLFNSSTPQTFNFTNNNQSESNSRTQRAGSTVVGSLGKSKNQYLFAQKNTNSNSESSSNSIAPPSLSPPPSSSSSSSSTSDSSAVFSKSNLNLGRRPHQVPSSQQTQALMRHLICVNHYRPPIPVDCPPAVTKAITSGFHPDPNQRMEAIEMVTLIKSEIMKIIAKIPSI